MSTYVGPGDLLLCRTEQGWAGKLIRLGALLRGELENWNHVCTVHHTDSAGTVWGIEGRPGGVGWVDVRKYLNDPTTITNVGQPKTATQRAQVAAGAVGLLGVDYDWKAIGLDAAGAAKLNLPYLNNKDAEGPPTHVVCSSLADWLYKQAGLACPAKMPWQLTTPADWADLVVQRGWQNEARPS